MAVREKIIGGLDGIDENARAIIIGLQILFAAAFVGMAIWTKYKPYAALLTAIIFFLSIWILGAILNPASIFSGLAIKVVLMVLLILGFRNAREAEALKRTFGK